jgi:DNA-binding GntR family transcriptional regulator
MIAFPQVKSISMRESVGEFIRDALYNGYFEPGQAISEAGLATEMGISRGPVREALLLLVQEGLVIHSPNRGFSVVQITAADLEEIHQVRIPLEATALTMAKPRVCEDDLAQLEALKNKMMHEYMDQNAQLSALSDMAFHGLIWERAGNSRLSGTLRTLVAPFFAYGSLFSSRALRRPDLTGQLIAEEHELMIDFLRGRTTVTAEDCIRFHLGL